MRMLIIGAVVAVALAAAGAARAGCWATAGVSPQPPDTAGTTWHASIKVMQHGRTPLADASPTLIIRNASSGESKRFPAKPTGEPGIYRADVVFPAAGTWRYEVNDGFPVRECAQTHTFAPVDISGGGGSSSRVWEIAGSTALGLALATLLVLGLRQSRRPQAAAAASGH
jgi:YtkA-like